MFLNFKKCVSTIKKYQEIDGLETYCEKHYEYFIKDIKVNEEVIKKIFVIDIRNMSDKNIHYLINNFEEFQEVVLANDFFSISSPKNKDKFNYRYNMDLILLYDKIRKYNIDRTPVLYNMEYAFKKFMTIEELKNYLNRDYKGINFDKEKLIELKNGILKLKRYNYINGLNGSGKTILLNEIANSLNVPAFSMNDISLDLTNNIQNKENIKKYLYQLTGSYDVKKYSDYEKYIHRLAQVLEFSSEQNNMLLLDDLRWGSLDQRNKINLIDTLFDYSVNNEGVVITGCSEINNIKRRIYKANIINLEKR